ncbi:MAG: DNA polymerase III subunit beta [Porticoccaceae bacterium]
MKLSITREALLKPLQLVAGVVERRQTLPILANVLITREGDRMLMTGTDLEVEIVGWVTLDGPGEDGSVTVPARKLVDICRSLPDAALISLSTEDTAVTIVSGRSRFTLSSLPASEFPSIDDSPGQLEFSGTEGALKQMIDNTAFAMAHQDVRYYLNGMLWEGREGKLRAVATDGHRLAMTTMSMPIGAEQKIQAILPRKAVVELSRMLSGDGEANVVIGTTHIRVVTAEFRFTSKLVDGAYPDYDRVLPRGGKQILIGNREDLRNAFARTAILSNEKYRGVRLMLTADQLRIVANNPVQEEAEEEIAVTYRGDEMEVGFNVGYILDALNVMRGTEARFTLSDANSSALVEDPAAENSLYVIMPMRL